MRHWLGVLGALGIGAVAGPALAGLTVCNDSGVSRSLAIGHGTEGNWISEGWWVIAHGDCRQVLPGALTSRYIYWRATAIDESFPDEGYMFCTSPEPFTIEGAEDCAARGYESAGFKLADTGTQDPDFTLLLTEANSAPAIPGLTGPVPASGPAFTPGQRGEPFAQSALLQGCQEIEGDAACVLYGEGWRYIQRAEGSVAEILAALRALPVNTSVQITGEILSEGDVSAEVSLSMIEPGPQDPHAAICAALQGDWVSADDPQAVMSIRGSEVTDSYGAEVLAMSILTLGEGCSDGTATDGVALSLVEPSRMDMGAICLGIDAVTAEEMTLINLPRGNFLTYRRR